MKGLIMDNQYEQENNLSAGVISGMLENLNQPSVSSFGQSGEKTAAAQA